MDHPALVMDQTLIHHGGFHFLSRYCREFLLFEFVAPPPRSRSTEGNHLLELPGGYVDSEISGGFNELVGKTGGAHQNHKNGFSPDDAHRSPTNGHDIVLSLAIG